jgi:4-hydroxythreonine-4-phosphate dehydrogenase
VIAVTTGDPAGIGPEICARLFARVKPARSAPLLVGAPGAFGPWLKRAGFKQDSGYRVFDDPGEAVRAAVDSSDIVILDTGVTDEYPVGEDSPGGGRHAGEAIKHACELVKNWSVRGIVTAPISKKSLNLADFRFTGHTEMLARYLNAPDCQMVMVCGNLRVVPLTRHVPLSEVSHLITEQSIQTCVRVVGSALTADFGIEAPRIAVAGLNPHASDRGVIGNEEESTIIPALEKLSAEGFDVTGPVPADALFPGAYRDFVDLAGERGRYDVYIAMYHDQGLAPFKMMAQRRGVNVTVGLPVIRCSVDHGVAYDIAGRGTGETESLFEAYKLAEEMSLNRFGRTGGR